MEAPPPFTTTTPPPMHPSTAKGKRTKRNLRPHSPIPFTPFFSSSSPPGAMEGLRLSLSPSLDNDGDSTTTEEVETAKCLLLLSQGGGFLPKNENFGGSYVHSRHHHQAPPLPRKSGVSGGGGGVYTCKTCSRTFSSFQALGGHRTSHRKIKTDKKSTSVAISDDEDFPAPPSLTKFSPNSLSLNLGTAETLPKPLSQRMHECSYCGAEFTSGQALGGHMRKHRGAPIVNRSLHIPINASFEEVEIEESSKRHKSGLPLDLNLPAMEDENHKFGIGKSPSRKYEAETGLGLSGGATPPPPLLIDKL